MRTWLVVLGVFAVGGALALAWSDLGNVPTVVLALFGWTRFLRETLPRVTLDLPGIAVGTVATVMFLLGSHLLLRSLVRSVSGEAAAGNETLRQWRWQWSLATVSMVLVMFIAGVSMIGIVHQLVWIAVSPEPLYEEVLGNYRGMTQVNRLKFMGLGVTNYADAAKVLPESGPQGAGHSWMTQIAPYMGLGGDSLDLEKPWDHPDNAPVFRKLNPSFLNSKFTKDAWRDANGWGLSHFAANQHVIGATGVRTPDEIIDGASETLLIGEVNADFSPWGRPGNSRDPLLGLNRSAKGFGGARGDSDVCFAMADGSVRTLNQNIDASVLQALSTPAGSDDTGGQRR